jgi:hypothetical protein
MSGNETSAIGSLRAINSGQTNFHANCGMGNSAASLASLYASPTAGGDGFISQDLSTDPAVKSGYTVTVVPGTATTPAQVCSAATTAATYAATANPVTVGSTGTRFFHINGTGAIFFNKAAIAAVQTGSPATGNILQ